ncbi:MAG TPA: CHAT domain-containing protein, partial [Thermoanaerobaculia bacterium]|nr:CHAT domain-containing protein [Thermoanaerobaculia bacterium]
QRETPILRHMRLPLATGSPPAASPLRLLVVSSQPRSMSHLSLEDERGKIDETLGRLPGVETVPLYNPDIETLRDVLLQQEFHVCHFMGHGGFDARSGQGTLYFADSHGAPVPVTGSLLASHLAGHDSLRLVFLNACDTARTRSGAPFAGVATALLRAGLPAVLAMQRPIRDGSALELSRTVYRRLALGDPIDAAVTEGRLAIARGHGALLEWGTPVLFSRVEDGHLFAAPEPVPAPHPRRSAPLFAAAAVAAVGLSIAVVQWPFGPASPPASSPSDRQVEKEKKAPASDTPAPKETVPEVIDPKPTPPPPQQRTQETRKPSRVEPPAAADETEREVRVSTPPRYEVSEGSPVFIPDLEAEVGATFFDSEGHSFAHFWVAPRGMEMLKQPPIMSPQSIAFPSPNGGTYRLNVKTLNLEAKSAEVALSFVP